MNNPAIHSIYFSPTGTTHAVTRAVCRGTGRRSGIHIDLNRPVGGNLYFAVDDPVVVAMPVYGGRLPVLAVERFKAVRGADTPVVAVVVYGNSSYGDALLELCDLCAECGFKVVSAAAFIGQHSFSSEQYPIAAHRPDQDDLRLAEEFGAQAVRSAQMLDLKKIPGNRPYKPEMKPEGAAAETKLALCTGCGQGVSHCPATAIQMNDGVPSTDSSLCIWCTACVQNCPTGARQITLPRIQQIAERLHTTCQTRRKPEPFLA